MPAHVNIVLPVYNAAPFLADAVQSLLDQTYLHISLLILDDGSTDASPDILADFARRDARIRIRRQSNAGGVVTLNRLIDWSLTETGIPRADFVALMHADDVALPTRIEKQVACFDAHPGLDILGSWIESFLTAPSLASQPEVPPQSSTTNYQSPITTPPHARAWHYPADPRFTKPYLLFWCCFAHPTMMFRRCVLEGTASAPPLRYDPDFPMPCEDYALWARAAEHYALGNVPEVLLQYRLHPAQASAGRQQTTAALTRRIRRHLLARLGIQPTDADLETHQRLAETELLPTLDFVRAARSWLERVRDANTQTHIYDGEAFAKILAARLAAACLHAAAVPGVAPDIWRTFWSSSLATYVDRTLAKNRSIPDP